jgi:hypothetical protein
MKRKISKSDYFKLIGLLALANGHNERLREINTAVRSITEEEDEYGHSSDAVYSDYSADQLLKKLDLTVSKK